MTNASKYRYIYFVKKRTSLSAASECGNSSESQSCKRFQRNHPIVVSGDTSVADVPYADSQSYHLYVVLMGDAEVGCYVVHVFQQNMELYVNFSNCTIAVCFWSQILISSALKMRPNLNHFNFGDITFVVFCGLVLHTSDECCHAIITF